MQEFVNPKWAHSSMVDSLLCADEWLSNSPCLALYSDIVYSARTLEPMLQLLDTIGVASYSKWFDLWSMRFEDVLTDAESFIVDHSGLISQIGSKADRIEDIQGQFSGMLQFQPESWEQFKRAIEDSRMKSTSFQDLTGLLGHICATERMPLRSIEVDGFWAEFDSASDLTAAEAFAVKFRSEFEVS